MVSVHDLRGLRRAARKRARRCLAQFLAVAGAGWMAQEKPWAAACAALDRHYAADAEYQRAEKALCERLNLPWYP